MTAEVTYRKKEKRGLDIETVLATAITAFSGGIGVIAVFAVLTGADIYAWNEKRMAGVYLFLSLLLWAFFILRERRTQKSHDI